MIRVYIKDGIIVKTVNEWYFDVEEPVEWATYQDVSFDINDHIIYEWWKIILYKESDAFAKRKKELEGKKEKTKQEQDELNYLLSL